MIVLGKSTKHAKKGLYLVVLLICYACMSTAWAQNNSYQHAFSVSASQQVYFSPGNLQYKASTNTWRFALSPWDYVGSDNSNISSTYDGWIDLFGWGTSGYHSSNDTYNYYYYPYSSYVTTVDQTYNYYGYGPSINMSSSSLTGSSVNYDWGVYNSISNGGNTTNIWRTLTDDEWKYVLRTRSTSSGVRYAMAIVNNVNGVILLPDDWQTSYYTFSSSGVAYYSNNIISSAQWTTLEQHGAVFFPAAGYRYRYSSGSSNAYALGALGSSGFYWSSTRYDNQNARCWSFYNGSFYNSSSSSRYEGLSVRLVRPAQNVVLRVKATTNVDEGGSVSGAEAYPMGAVCTLTATPSAGYTFLNWMEGGEVVSTESTFSFHVLSNRFLTANFVATGNIAFDDANVKAKCVANWDTNGDGELSYVEAAAVTNLGTVFKNNTTITKFNELQYFLSLGTIGEQAFYGCTALTQVTIPTSVAYIYKKAFWNCPALQSLYYYAAYCLSMQTNDNNDVYSVFSSNDSGSASAITRVVFGNSVMRIPDYAFKGSNNIYQNITIPASVTEIGDYAFHGCNSIWGMNIQGNGLKTIGDYAFYGCSSLRTVQNFLPNSVTNVGRYAFYGCSLLPELTIGTDMSTVGGYAFWNCPALTVVHFNATNCQEMSTNTSANYYTSVFKAGTSNGGAAPIVTLTIGENVTRIPRFAFDHCTNLTSAITIPDATTYIGRYAFYGARSAELTIGKGVKDIYSYAFWNCPNLTTVHFNATSCTSMYTITGSGTTDSPYVYYSVFKKTGTVDEESTPIVHLTIGDHVTKIPTYAFKNSHDAIGGLLFSNHLTYIGQSAFEGCNSFTGDLVIPNAIITLGESAFKGCSGFDGSLVIGGNLVTIQPNTFADCSGFTGSLIVGRSVNSIGINAFQNCSGITSLIAEKPMPPTALDNTFEGMNFTIPVYVQYGKISNYQSATGWSQFSNYKNQCVFDYFNNNLWSDANNWRAMELPTENDVVCVNSYCQLDMDANVLHLYVQNLDDAFVINEGSTLTTTYGVSALSPTQIVVADGGQLVNPISNVCGTVQKHINGYGAGDDGWFTVASPIYRGSNASDLTIANYDLYAYDEPTAFWENQKENPTPITVLHPAQGYLYANETEQTLSFANYLNASNAMFTLPVTCQNSVLPGFNLLGNPYTNNININSVSFNNVPITSYYKAVGGSQLVAYTDADDDAIKPAEGFFVQVPEDGMVTFNTPSRMEDGSYIRLVLNRDNQMVDRAYLRMNEGATLNKAFVKGHPSLLYLTSDGQPYAVAPRGAKAYNLCFEPKENGVFTVESSLLNAEVKYLHLIDNFTGVDIDLLKTPRYTFRADTTDVSNRFVLMLAAGAYPEDEPIGLRGREIIPILPSHGGTVGQPAYLEGLVNIVVTVNPEESGTITGDGTYQHGESVTLTATANEGYEFVSWTMGEETVTENPYVFTVTSDLEVVANFSIQRCSITATANPSSGGTVSGANTYNYNSTATLTATATEGFTFVNWTENGEEVSTDPTYVFTVTGDRSLVANFVETITPATNHWTPQSSAFAFNMTLTGVIQINGVEQTSDQLEVGAFCGDECRGSQQTYYFAPAQRYIVQLIIYGETGDMISFRLYDHATEQEIDLVSPAPVAFNADGYGSLSNPYVLNFSSSITQTTALTQGWNWWGTYIELAGNDGLSQLENSLGEHGLTIKSRENGFAEPFSDGSWYGNLTSLCNEQMYMIRTNADCEASVTGQPAIAAHHPITLNPGWTWIGFPSQQPMSVGTAMSGITPEGDDIVKGRNGYATYYTGDGNWYGTLNTLEPGQGYMYQSLGDEAKTLVYNTNRSEATHANITPKHNMFKPYAGDYANNMTLTAVVELNGNELRQDGYELSAFVGDECRGSVKLLWVAPLDRYVAFLTVFGEQDETMTFRLTDGTAIATAAEKQTFTVDAILGTLTSPVVLRFGNLGIDDSVMPQVSVYPNPSDGVFQVEGTGIERVEVYNTLGQRVFMEKAKADKMSVDLKAQAEGLYTLRVVTANGVSVHNIVKR